MTFHPGSLPDLTGCVYIVTGATSGIGYHTAARLAEHDAKVYICARTAFKGSSTVTSIQALYPSANLSVLVMDHTNLSSVVAAAKHFLSRETRLNGLVNNAGIMSTPFAMTSDGYEEQFQTNYLAHWVFTHHLLPIMLETAKGKPAGSVRIVNLSSYGHHSAPKGGINFEDTSLKNGNGMTRYGQSKLANVLHTKTLHKLYGPSSSSTVTDDKPEIWTTAVHPGLVKSNLGERAQLPALVRALIAPIQWAGGAVDADTGAWTSVFCVASPEMKKEDAGAYFQRIADPRGWQSGTARDAGLAEMLEDWTGEEMRRWVG
jgi:retinol dehydrogenase-12